MSVIELILLLLVAGILGVVSQRITGIQAGGLVMSIILGAVGAWLGKQISVWLDIHDPIHLSIGSTRFPLLCAILGCAIVTTAVGLMQWHARRRKAEKKK